MLITINPAKICIIPKRIKNVIISVKGTIINKIPYNRDAINKIFFRSNLFDNIPANNTPKAFNRIKSKSKNKNKERFSAPNFSKTHGSKGYSKILSP